ncbi:hypothetical protein CCHR01_03977 [Colletotrichum chrysophilum]|uniref:Uncharacterized protein n=1 Tax=Colletotrichum chrysophilum TaxID=1836956 RepID=A0AAD9ELW8_9PEZI|nr:hypothetical protein CCHR01_03977 [Colletotrichum chrysophilum]
MVYISPPTNVPKLNAYVTTSLPDDALAKLKKAFELGACSRFSPVLEMVIKDDPSYHNKSHAEIRRAEDAAGRTDGFVIIDSHAASDVAVWYVDSFATQDQVDSDEAESVNVLVKILVKAECLPLTWVNYEIANIDIMEDLDNCGVEMPLTGDYEQSTISNCGGMDMEEQQSHQQLWFTAEPGEFEESTDPNHLDNFRPRPEKVAKLYENLAKEDGIVAHWTIPSPARSVKLPDGSKKTFPEGSIILQHTWNPQFPWPEYKWPEGSL